MHTSAYRTADLSWVLQTITELGAKVLGASTLCLHPIISVAKIDTAMMSLPVTLYSPVLEVLRSIDWYPKGTGSSCIATRFPGLRHHKISGGGGGGGGCLCPLCNNCVNPSIQSIGITGCGKLGVQGFSPPAL